MKPDNRAMYLGAILTLIGSWLVIVPKSPWGMGILGISNLFLVYYAITVILEYCRNLLNPTDESAPPVE